jgi:hypothetical protein
MYHKMSQPYATSPPIPIRGVGGVRKCVRNCHRAGEQRTPCCDDLMCKRHYDVTMMSIECSEIDCDAMEQQLCTTCWMTDKHQWTRCWRCRKQWCKHHAKTRYVCEHFEDYDDDSGCE